DIHLALVVRALDQIECRFRRYASPFAPSEPGKVNLRLAKIGGNVALAAILHAEINRHRTGEDGVQPRKDRIPSLVVDIQPDFLLAFDRTGPINWLNQTDLRGDTVKH